MIYFEILNLSEEQLLMLRLLSFSMTSWPILLSTLFRLTAPPPSDFVCNCIWFWAYMHASPYCVSFSVLKSGIFSFYFFLQQQQKLIKSLKFRWSKKENLKVLFGLFCFISLTLNKFWSKNWEKKLFIAQSYEHIRNTVERL